MKLSIVNSILNSQEIIRRQILYYNSLNLPKDVEVIWVDDGSDPPLDFSSPKIEFNFQTFQTNDYRIWTQPIARNRGARRAKGLYTIFTDIDHIIPKELIEIGRDPWFDVIRLQRQAAVLDENGKITQDRKVLKSYGLLNRYFRRGLRLPPHGNSYLIRTELYLKLGGVAEHVAGTGNYPNREEIPLKRKIKKLWEEGEITVCDDERRPIFYMIPNGKYCGDKDYNPFDLFHTLSRKNNKNRREERRALRRKKNESKKSKTRGA
ncbi:MAG: glycosyltransferase [Planctomycetota bacterium]|jgi:hypothetical protein